MRVARSALELEDRADELDTVALRLLRFGFDRVALPRPTLGYEPRSSAQCGACAALWVGSKAGPTLRIDLQTASGRAEQRFLPGNREARTLKHLHACRGFSTADASFLLIGRDDGFLEIVEGDGGFTDSEPRQISAGDERQGFHIGVLRRSHPDTTVNWRTPDRYDATIRERHKLGITAIETITDGANAHWLVVATRAPELHVLRAEAGVLVFHGTLAMPGWIEWIVQPQLGRTDVLCVSRGGEIVRVALAARPWGAPDAPLPTQSLALHPMAVLPFGDGLLIGTKRGLAVVNGTAKAIALPITRAPVLCLDRATIPGTPAEHYITMGLDDGRLRVINQDDLARLVDRDRPPGEVRRFWVEIGEGVLALETLCTPLTDEVFVLAIPRDHTLHLYKVQGEAAQVTAVADAWERRVRAIGLEPAAEIAAHREAVAALLREPGDEEVIAARQNLVVVHVLERLRALADRATAIELALQIAADAGARVLRALTRAMGGLGGGDVMRVLALSRAVLSGLARGRSGSDRRLREWESAIHSHLGQLHRLASESKGDDRTRLIAWARFVRKYIVRSQTFVAKRLGLGALVEQNDGNTKYFDALIYHALLMKRGYDLHWELALDGEVSQVHAVRDIVVLVGSDATLRFVDRKGRPLPVCDERGRDRLAGTEAAVQPPGTVVPFRVPAPDSAAWTVRRRTLASLAQDHAAWTAHGLAPVARVRVVLAVDGEGVPPAGLAVIELRRTDAGLALINLEHVRVTPVPEDARAVRVHALQALPGTQILIAGLQSPEHPVGRLSCTPNHGWTIELAQSGDALDDPRDSDLSMVAPGKLPTRALAVSALFRDHFLVVAGSDDGRVRVFQCRSSEPAVAWQITRWQQLTSAVTSVVLGRHPDRPPGGPVLSCYLATAGGETFALSIVDRLSQDGADFGNYYALPLWRETHDSPVVAMHMWQTPLYGDHRDETQAVLAVATRNGRLILHNHGCFDSTRVSLAQNYWFRGKRLERMMLPCTVSAIALPVGREVIAAAPDGRVYAARLVFPRDSDERGEPDAAPRRDHTLPREMWAQFRHLLGNSDVDWVFAPADHQEEMLQLLDLVPIPAVREYVLRQRLEPRDPWLAMSAEDVKAQAHGALRGLEPDRAEDAARIKIILKAVSRAFLWRAPVEVAAIIRNGGCERREQTATTCEIVSGYLTHELARSTAATARLRVVALKELLRVGLLHHMAQGEDTSERIRASVKTAFETCLRDDERVVRIEALRALSVMLRNVRLMEKASPGIVDRLFPRGLASLAWALDPVLERLARFPAHRNAGALISNTWYRISVLAHVFRLFPDHTLSLCARVSRARGGADAVRHCLELLQRPSATPSENDGEQPRLVALMQLYLLGGEGVEDPSSVRQLQRAMPQLPELGASLRLPSGELDVTCDAVLAPQLARALAVLESLWTADRAKIRRGVASAGPCAIADEAFAGLAATVAELLKLGGELARMGRGALGMLHGIRDGLAARRATMPPASVAVVHRILDGWLPVTLEGPPEKSHVIVDRYTLGVEHTRLEPLHDFAASHGGEDYDAVVLWSPESDDRNRFARAVQLQQQLSAWPTLQPYVVEIIARGEKPWPAYVTRLQTWLADTDLTALGEAERLELCEHIACDISKVLAAVHGGGESLRGAISRSSVAVEHGELGPSYRLGRFERKLLPPGQALVPSFLLDHRGLDSRTVAYQQWRDVAALLLVLDEVLTLRRLEQPHELAAHVSQLHRLSRAVAERPRLLAITKRLRQLFRLDAAPFAIGALLATPAPPPRFEGGHALVIGVASYQRISGLPESVSNDAHDLAELLCSEGGYLPGNVRVLVDAEATAAGIQAAFAWLAAVSRGDGTSVVFFSGHGARRRQPRNAYLLPHDCDPRQLEASAIDQHRLADYLSAIRSGRLAVFLDACHAARDLQCLVEAELDTGLDDGCYHALAQGTGRAILAASRENEAAAILPELPNSLFTHHLLKALRGAGGSDSLVRITEVVKYVSDEIARKGQHATLTSSKLEDFAIAVLGGPTA